MSYIELPTPVDLSVYNTPAREILSRLIAAGRDQIHREWARLIDEQAEWKIRNALSFAPADIGPEAAAFLKIAPTASYAHALDRIEAMIREASRTRW